MARVITWICMALPLLLTGPVFGVSAVAQETTSAISKEPFYADLVTRAERLKTETEAFKARPSLTLLSQRRFRTYVQNIRTLTEGDLNGHLDLKKRGTDNDLKCIMKGLSLDLPIKLKAIESARSKAELTTALDHMSALLDDNIEVITTPGTADSGLDCVIEFGNS